MSYRYIAATLFMGASLLTVAGCTSDVGDVGEADLGESVEELASNGYIVVLKDGTPAQERASEVAAAHGVTIGHVYKHALQGFSFRGSAQAAEQIAKRSDVAYIEPDGVATLPDDLFETTGGKPGGGGSATQTTPWGITRIGGAGDGTGKTVWIIDTGIDFEHADLKVDVGRSANFARGSSADDGNGHGTHVAGTIAALNNSLDVVGVAAGATVVAVRVLDNSGSGTWSGVIAGIDHVAANGKTGDVANMSLGGGYNQSLNDAVANAASKGIKFAVAAGNDGADCKNYSPASTTHSNVYTVSAIGTNDCLTSWSNYGAPVDVAAPGASILSTRNGGGTTTMSGTSMASPHVAGLLLLGALHFDGAACGDKDGKADGIGHR
jgi:subtilisin family serine protease